MIERLTRFFRTNRPPDAFVLTRNRLVYVGRREGKGTPLAVILVSRALPPETWRPGPAGIPVASQAALAKVVSELVKDSGARVSAASVAIPDDFVRVSTQDFEDPEKSTKETDEVLRWKFGKVFGDAQPALRMAWQTAGAGAEGTRVVAMATLEESAAAIEAAFTQAGVRVGALESAALAVSTLARKAIPADGFIVWADGDAATTVFLKGGNLRFLRTKATSDPDEALQEIRLAASFVSADSPTPDVLGIDADGDCAAGPVGSPIVNRFRAFRAELGGRDPKPISRVALAPEALLLGGVSAIAGPTLAGAEDPALLVGLGLMAPEG